MTSFTGTVNNCFVSCGPWVLSTTLWLYLPAILVKIRKIPHPNHRVDSCEAPPNLDSSHTGMYTFWGSQAAPDGIQQCVERLRFWANKTNKGTWNKLTGWLRCFSYSEKNTPGNIGVMFTRVEDFYAIGWWNSSSRERIGNKNNPSLFWVEREKTWKNCTHHDRMSVFSQKCRSVHVPWIRLDPAVSLPPPPTPSTLKGQANRPIWEENNEKTDLQI